MWRPGKNKSQRQSSDHGRKAESAWVTLWFATMLAVSAGCVDETPTDYGDPGSLSVPSTSFGITVAVLKPSALKITNKPQVDLVISAYTTYESELEVKASVGELGSVILPAEGKPGSKQRFRTSLPLLHGPNPIRLHFRPLSGTFSRTMKFNVVYDGQVPGMRFQITHAGQEDNPCELAVPIVNGLTAYTDVCISGRVSERSSPVTQVKVNVGDNEFGLKEVDENKHFHIPARLQVGKRQEVSVTATDKTGRNGTASVSVIQDNIAPNLNVILPEDVQVTTDEENRVKVHLSADELLLTGEVSDENGVSAIWIVNPNGYRHDLFLESRWERVIKLKPGQNRVAVMAEDTAGNQSVVNLDILRDMIINLGKAPPKSEDIVLELDRLGMSEMLTREDQEAIEVIKVKMRPLVRDAVEAIRDPDKRGVDTSEWSAAEWNMHHLMSMTPSTADVTGTTMEGMFGISDGIGLAVGSVLSKMMDIEPDDVMIDLETMVDVLLDNVISTHPNVEFDSETGEPILRITLYDTLQELRTFAERFGPVDGHPGFVRGEVKANLFEPGFKMIMPLRSNLNMMEGLDASRGTKDYIFIKDGDTVLEFDYLDESFDVVGMVDEPTTTLSFAMTENPRFLEGGDTRKAGADPDREGFYRGNSEVWLDDPWSFERLVAEAAYRQFSKLYADSDYQETLRYDIGNITDATVIKWDRGWVEIITAGNLGDPPEPQYYWDMVCNISQVRLHDNGVDEGEANLGFTINDLSVGMDSVQLLQIMRETMETQKHELSLRMAGEYGLTNSGCDVYYVPSMDKNERGFLFFRAAVDSDISYNYTKPGFYSDATLAQKASSTEKCPGTDDTEHEKIQVKAGDVLYFSDDTDVVYRLTIDSADAEGLTARLSQEAWK